MKKKFMWKLLTLSYLFCTFAFSIAQAAQASTYSDLKGSYTLIQSSKTNESCPTGLRIGDASCSNGLWVQERESHFTTIICNINGGTERTSSNGHSHSIVPIPEKTSTTNTFDPSHNVLMSKTTSWSLFGRDSYYTVYSLLETGKLKLSIKYSDAPLFNCEYNRDASNDYLKSID